MGAFLFLLRAQVRDKASLSTARSGMSAWFRLPDLFWRDPGLLIHLCIAHVGFAEIGSPVEYFSEDGSALGGKAEIGAAQVGSAQVWSERGMLFSPGIPDCSSLFQQVKLFLIGHRVFLLRWSSSSSIAWWMPIRKPSYGTMPTRIDKEIVPSTRRGIIDAGQHKRPETTQAHQPAHR